MRSLVILRNTKEAEHFLAVHSLANAHNWEPYQFLSLQPNVEAYLLSLGIKCLNSSQLVNRGSYQKIMRKCLILGEKMGSWRRGHAAELPEPYVVNYADYFFRLTWRSIFKDIEMVQNCFKLEKFERVLAYAEEKPYDLFSDAVAGQLCQKLGAKFVALKMSPSQAKHLLQPEQRAWFEKIGNMLSYHILRAAAKLFSRKISLLVPILHYNVDTICNELRELYPSLKICFYFEGRTGLAELSSSLAIFFCTIFGQKMKPRKGSCQVDFAIPLRTFAKYHAATYDDGRVRQFLKALLAVLDSDDIRDNYFEGIELFDFISRQLHSSYFPYVLKTHFLVHGLSQALELVKPNFILSPACSGEMGALGPLARKIGALSVLISHGSHIAHEDQYAALEHAILANNILIGDYQVMAVQSPHAKKMAENLVAGNRILDIYPILWGRKIQKHHRRADQPLTLVHAGTSKPRGHVKYMYESSDEMVEALKDICGIVKDLPNLKLVIKIRPSREEYGLATLNQLLPQAPNIVFETQKPFLEVLPETDLLISFSSTTIEEALNNDIPVLQYGGQGRYAHIPVLPSDKIEGAVTFAKDKQSLYNILTELNEHYQDFQVPEEKFWPHKFNQQQAVDFVPWFLDQIKEKTNAR